MSIDAKGFALLLALLLFLGRPVGASAAASPGTENAIGQRQQLQSARLAIAQGDSKTLEQLKTELSGHPLLPYLDYWALSQKLSSLPYNEIDQFLHKYRETAIGDWVRIKVLQELGSRQRFRAFLKYYDGEKIHRASLQCYYADALSRHGDQTEANRLTGKLWLVGHSQAEECDPVFARWIRDGGLTDDLAWRRHMLTLAAGNLDLAQYISSKMSNEQAQLAALARSVHHSPEQLLEHQRFLKGKPEYRQIALHGLRRLAAESASNALAAWHHYDAGYLFEDFERQSFLRDVALQFARRNNLAALQQLIQESENFSDERTIEWLARQALREQNWAQMEFWIDQLPEKARNHERWLYWRARILEERHGPSRNEEAAGLYRQAAQQRSYYGFLAADTLGQNYSFVDRPAPIPPLAVEEMAARPAMLRARELQALGELYHARREWDYATRGMSPTELLAAGRLASNWGWHHKSIRSVLAADYLDDLELRFPLAFSDIVTDVSQRIGKESTLDPYLIYAVARQESHFSHDAKSGAGALGLMQLLPSTARATARRAGVPFRRNWDLLSPSTNIALGGFYLSTLLNRFDNNRILAAAAYNAGPTRVAQWLRETRQQLPYDIWIETIPYRETRHYVQNVLAYSVIYAYRSGASLPLLRENEAATRL
ncbi:soluble lytic murein transglycosylase [Microbulbifer aestuariivivens]|uniref:Soluble lytic murein transglycosylase n=1 Tax=Microbulbifer aestuariivivens TaxID=1908308 RepID=A0ABP9WLZ9_9GAMM